MTLWTTGAQDGAPKAGVDLTMRQLECLAWVQEGKSARDIGQILGISGRTVEKYVGAACEKLGVRTRVQAVVRARNLGLLTDADTARLSAPRRRPL